MRRLLLAALLLVASPGLAAARAMPHGHHPAAAPRLYHLPRLRVTAPVWMGFEGKLAMLENQVPGEPATVAIWDPRKSQLGRATLTTVGRHSLVGAQDGRLAFVESGGPPAPPPDPACQPGPDRIVVYDFQHGATKAIFEGGAVVPDSLHWSPDGTRLAFLCFDTRHQAQLALLESGKPLQLTKLPIKYLLRSIAGFVGDRDVLATALRPDGEETFLRVGHSGIISLPAAESPKLSFDGRWILTRAAGSQGVALRGTVKGGRVLSTSCQAFAWGPAERIYLAEGADIVAISLQGKLLSRYPRILSGPPDELAVSPDGKLLAIVIAHELWALAL